MNDLTLLVKNLLFTLLIPGTVALFIPLRLTAGHAGAGGLWPAVAGLLFLLGGGIYFWCLWDFATFGRGTPLPLDAPKQLVIRGPYRFSRNPMYLGVLVTLLGWTALVPRPALLLYTLVVALLFHTFVLLYEEPHLRRRYGSAYTDYRTAVRRWL